MSKDTPYDVLGVKKTDSKKTINKAYRNLAKRWHPDKNNGDKQAEEKFKSINKAYQRINNPSLFKSINSNVYTGTPFNFNFGMDINEEKFKNMTDELLDKSKKFSNWYNNIKNLDFNQMTNNIIKEATRYKAFYDESVNDNKDFFSDSFSDSETNDADNSNNNNKNNRYPEGRTDDIIINVRLSLEDIYNKTKKSLNIKRTRKCRCCLGLGMFIDGACKECQNNKYKDYYKTFEFKSNLKSIVFFKESNEESKKLAGNIVINVTPRPHDTYLLINDYDILYQKVLDKDQTEFSFKYLDNKEYQINVKDYKINQLIKYQENNGIYKYNSETRGDLYIQLLRSNTEIVIKPWTDI